METEKRIPNSDLRTLKTSNNKHLFLLDQVKVEKNENFMGKGFL
ncbi:hypothetical protein OIU78_003928 [Salix suchowensis]|uniref:Uncharacterized protein n=2 Tax=Salix TaxID=40685 RepID=A0A9Q0T4R8_SALPP|nr:hypothetical protein OIU78_003928 [Salix suchowensis]KAJ6700445.1 hypothetical protein OIU79_013475 [Salix purpurea]